MQKNKPIPKILYASEIIDKAFGKARKVPRDYNERSRLWGARKHEAKKVDAVYQVVDAQLKKTYEAFPDMREMSKTHQELIALMIDIGDFKQSISAVRWAMEFNKELWKKYKGRFHGAQLQDCSKIRTEFYGRVRSALKQIDKNLQYLEAVRQEFRRLPPLEDMPTVVIAGFPNVGKSSLMEALTGSEPEVKPYPFTTKGMLLGAIDNQLQLVDTPGLLDRLPEKRNDIEEQAAIALRHLANKVLFIVDPSESCGYTLEDQENLLKTMKKEFNKEIVLVVNKADLPGKKFKADFTVSAKEGKGVQELKEHLLKTTRMTLEKSYRKKK